MKDERGFIQFLLLLIIAIALVNYFHIDVGGIWKSYLAAPAGILWNFFLTYVWNPILEGLNMYRNKQGIWS